jgi:hypothetical protein
LIFVILHPIFLIFAIGQLPRVTEESYEAVEGCLSVDEADLELERISVPIHGNKTLKTGLLKYFLKVSGISEDEL